MSEAWIDGWLESAYEDANGGDVDTAREDDEDEPVECEHGPAPHEGHYSRLGGTWWCDTCNSPYCCLA